MMQIAGKSAIVGGIAYVASAYVIGGGGEVDLPLLGLVSSNTAVGIAVGGASLVGATAGQYIVPMLRQSPSLQNLENRALQPALTGMASLLVGKMLGDIPSPVMLLAFGAGCQVAGDYAWATISPML